MTAISTRYSRPVLNCVSRRDAKSQRGVVLIVALILLVVLSMVSAAAIRGSSSAELSTNNARTQTLAMQAAEAALRYCEKATLNFMSGAGATPTLTPEAAPATSATPYRWQTLTNWDGTGSGSNITTLVSADVNDRTDNAGKLYKRYPECTAQYLEPANTKRVVVTARGFGPDVAAITGARAAPVGAEVWLQSVLSAD